MKIHIVRKGDTLWEIAQQYGVDFEELKQFNPQLSSPDMIMPGMKIKIPSATKEVKKETVSVKESKKPIAKETPKKLPVVQEDDHHKAKEVKIEMPEKFTLGTTPKPLATKKEMPVKKEVPKAPTKPIKKAPIVKESPKPEIKPMKEMIKMPVIEEEAPFTLPETSKPKEKKQEEIPQQAPLEPIYHYYHCCCPPPYHPCFPVMGEMTGGFMPYQQMHHGHEHLMHHMQMNQAPMNHMPIQSQQMAHHPHDCGCSGTVPHMHQYQMREQMPEPFPGVGLPPLGYQPYIEHIEPQMRHVSREVPTLQPQFNNEFNHSFEKPFPMPPSFPPVSETNVQVNEQEDESTNE